MGDVFNPVTLTFALVGGIVVGFAIVAAVVNRRFTVGPPTPRVSALLTGWYAILAGGVFYGSQVIGAVWSGDPFYYRIIERFCLWLAYAATIAVAVFVGVSLRRRLP